MASLLYPVGAPILDANGKPVIGAKIYVYDAGTTTPASTYSDAALSVAHAHPIVASAGFWPAVFVASGQKYKIDVKTASDAAVPGAYPFDNITVYAASDGGALPVANGGTGATTAANARTNLGAAASTDVSTISVTVSAFAAGQDTADWEAGTATDETGISPAKVKAAIVALEATQSGVPEVTIYETQSNGTDGGTFTAGAWQTRVLNLKQDPGGVCTLSSNTMTFTKDGFVRFSAPAYNVGGHKARLYNVTDGVPVTPTGTTERMGSSSNVMTRSWGFVEVVKSKAYRVEHYCGTTKATDGFGIASNTGDAEIYAFVEFFSKHGE